MAIPYTYWQDADGWFVGYAPRPPSKRSGEGSSRRGAERQRAQRVLAHAFVREVRKVVAAEPRPLKLRR